MSKFTVRKFIFMKRNILVFCMLLSGIQILRAQTEGSAFNQTGRGGTATTFATDYEAIGINPANLGMHTEYTIGLGIAEFGFSIYSKALEKDEVHNILFNNDDKYIDSAEQKVLGEAFLNNGITYNADVRLLGMSIRTGENSALAFSFDGSANYYSKLGENASSIIFQGYDFTDYIDTIIVTPDDTFGVAYEPLSLSEIMKGTSVRFNVRNDINLAYGSKLFGNDKFSIYGGIGVKYVMSFAYFDFESDGTTITGTSALGLGILDLNQFDTPSEIITETYKPVGKGFGFDLGLTMKSGEKFTAGIALTDIGKVHYTANVLQLNDVVLDTIDFSGVTSIDPIQLIEQITKNENIIAYNGISEFNAALPATLRLGAGYKASESLNLGADIIMPLNDVGGSYEKALMGLGAELKVAKVLKLSSGVNFGGGYDFNISGGIGLDFKIWEIGVATRDLLTVFGQDRPTISMAAGFLRFKI